MIACWGFSADSESVRAALARYVESCSQKTEILLGICDADRVPAELPRFFAVLWSDGPMSFDGEKVLGPGTVTKAIGMNQSVDYRFALQNGLPQDLIEGGSILNSQTTDFVVLKKRDEVPSGEFLPHLTRHVLAFRHLMHTADLKGYVVLALGDQVEFTFINIDAQAMSRLLETPAVQSFVADQVGFLNRLQKSKSADTKSLRYLSN